MRDAHPCTYGAVELECGLVQIAAATGESIRIQLAVLTH